MTMQRKKPDASYSVDQWEIDSYQEKSNMQHLADFAYERWHILV
jgi:hypothetical protein